MSRRPYVRPMPATWFMEKPAYRFYMVREASCLFSLAYCINLFAGLLQLVSGPESWESWLAFQAHPSMIVFAQFVLLMTLLHAITFINMAPRVSPQQVRKMVPDNVVRAVMFAGLAVVSSVIIAVVAMGGSL